MRKLLLPLFSVSLLALAGCTSLSGVGGDSKFRECAGGEGVPCKSISGITSSFEAGVLPFQQIGAPTPSQDGTGQPLPMRKPLNYGQPQGFPTAAAAAPGQAVINPSLMAAPTSGTPIRTPERLLRIWFAPSRTPDDTMLDQAYAYVLVEPGRWRVATPVTSGAAVATITRIAGSDAPATPQGRDPKAEARGLAATQGRTVPPANQ